MHACLQKKIAFNPRVLKNEEEVSGINSSLAEFLQDMNFDLENPVFVSANVGERMRGTQPMCGQLWTQKSRQMTASSSAVQKLDGSRESIALSGVVDVLIWRHAVETSIDPDFKRLGRRVIVYPKFLNKLGLVLATANIGLDTEGRRDLGYEKVLEQSMTWPESLPPVMLQEDSPERSRWPALAQHAQKWMEDAKRIAVAGYRQVLEDGPDVCDSKSEAEYSDHGEQWSYADMYTLF
jgi:hypothetical protein